jgi:hypothetical protein
MGLKVGAIIKLHLYSDNVLMFTDGAWPPACLARRNFPALTPDILFKAKTTSSNCGPCDYNFSNGGQTVSCRLVHISIIIENLPSISKGPGGGGD